MFDIYTYLYVSLNTNKMTQFTEVLLPILFTALVTYFIGSVTRLFIHLLINENANN